MKEWAFEVFFCITDRRSHDKAEPHFPADNRPPRQPDYY